MPPKTTAVAKRKPITQNPTFLKMQARAKSLASSKSKAIAKQAKAYRVGQYVASIEVVGGAFLAGYLPAKLGVAEVMGVDVRVGVGLVGFGLSMALPAAIAPHALALSTGFLASFASDAGEAMALGSPAATVEEVAA